MINKIWLLVLIKVSVFFSPDANMPWFTYLWLWSSPSFLYSTFPLCVAHMKRKRLLAGGLLYRNEPWKRFAEGTGSGYCSKLRPPRIFIHVLWWRGYRFNHDKIHLSGFWWCGTRWRSEAIINTLWMLRKPEDRLTQAKRYKADNYKAPRQMFYLLMQSANIIYHGICILIFLLEHKRR